MTGTVGIVLCVAGGYIAAVALLKENAVVGLVALFVFLGGLALLV